MKTKSFITRLLPLLVVMLVLAACGGGSSSSASSESNRHADNADGYYNGQYSFRLANPRNTIVVTYPGYETADIPVNKQAQDISIRKQAPLPPVEVIDHPMLDWLVDEYPNMELLKYWESDAGSKHKPQDIYLPYRDNITYGSIQELFDNLYLGI